LLCDFARTRLAKENGAHHCWIAIEIPDEVEVAIANVNNDLPFANGPRLQGALQLR
jgi:hypothetical protein